MARRLLVVVAVLLVAPAALAQDELYMQQYIRTDGTAGLNAGSGPDAVRWQRCDPNGSCTDVVDDDGDATSQTFAGGNPPAGTTFVATQDGKSSRSRPWTGLVTSTSPPRVQGTLRVGSLVRPVAGAWTGGWANETDHMQLQVCSSSAATACLVLSDTVKFACAGAGARYIPARYRGTWLRVVDSRNEIGMPTTGEGYLASEAIGVSQPSQATAAAVVGKIGAGASHHPGCGDPPLQRALRADQHGRFTVATLRCGFTLCAVRVVVSQGSREVRAIAQLKSDDSRSPATRIHVSARRLRAFHAGEVSLMVFVNGQLTALSRPLLRR